MANPHAPHLTQDDREPSAANHQRPVLPRCGGRQSTRHPLAGRVRPVAAHLLGSDLPACPRSGSDFSRLGRAKGRAHRSDRRKPLGVGCQRLRHAGHRRGECAHLPHADRRADRRAGARRWLPYCHRLDPPAVRQAECGARADAARSNPDHGLRRSAFGGGRIQRCAGGGRRTRRRTRPGLRRAGSFDRAHGPGHADLYLRNHRRAEGRGAHPRQHRGESKCCRRRFRLYPGRRLHLLSASLAHHGPCAGLCDVHQRRAGRLLFQVR